MSQIPKTCTEAETLLGAYVIGATTHKESLAIEALLAECPQLVDELSSYMLVREQLSMMASTAPAPFPSEDLVESSWLDVPSHLEEMGEAVTGESRATALKKLQPVTPPSQDNSQGRLFPVAMWYAFGSIAASIILVVGMVATAERLLNQLEQDRAVLTMLINDYQNDMSQIQPTRDQISGLQTADHIELSPALSDVVDDGQAEVIWDSQSSVGVLIITNMPDLDSNQRYQMWLVKDNMETSVGVFQVDATGSGNLVFHLSEPLESFEIIGISVEPEGGSPTPTTPHLVIGEIDL